MSDKKKSVVVGLTGQTGAGKSLVSSILSEHEYSVLDADIVARQVVMKGKDCLLDLVIEFGVGILCADGTLNRRKLGNIVFGDKEKQAMLNKITFPYIQQEISAQIQQLREQNIPLIFLDAPTLLESGANAYCDKVVSVIAPAEVRLERILKRDGITTQQAIKRMSAQQEDDYYTSRSDFVVQNTGDIAQLRVNVMQMLAAVENT